MDIIFILTTVLGFFLLLSLIILVYNFFTAPKVYNTLYDLEYTPLVSILVPARNEENNIEECVRSILHLGYNNFELLILDDESIDRTVEIVKPYADRNSKIKIIRGKPLPDGWLGKNWACKQLADHSSGEMLLFLDADVRLEEDALNSALFKMQYNSADILSVFPTQIMKSFGEFLIVPLLNWFLLSFLPLVQVFKSRRKSLLAAIGQFIMFKRDIYFSLGGHESVKDKIVEDMEIAAAAKSNSYKVLSALGHDAVNCRMYDGFDDAYNGFVKNFFPGFKTSPIRFILIISFIVLVYLLPIILSFFYFQFIWLVLAIVLNRLLVSLLSSQSPFIGIIHPLQMLLFLSIGISSVKASESGNVKWKDRNVASQ